MEKKLAVIVGAGPGMGISLARVFGSHDYKAVLIARNKEHLEALKDKLSKEGVECDIQTADAADTDSLRSAFSAIKERHGAADVMIYNVCVLKGGMPSELDNNDFMYHYQVDVASALLSAQIVLPDMLERKSGGIFFTGGGLAIYPMPECTNVSVNKAALRALATALSGEVREKGIYVGTVTIMGAIAPNTHYDPDKIAEKYWNLYENKTDIEYIFK